MKWKHGWGKHRAKCPSQFERASKLESWKPLRKYGKRLGWLVGGFDARMAAKEGLPAETSCCKTTDNILIRHFASSARPAVTSDKNSSDGEDVNAIKNHRSSGTGRTTWPGCASAQAGFIQPKKRCPFHLLQFWR